MSVRLEEYHYHYLKNRAKREAKSISAIIRELIEAMANLPKHHATGLDKLSIYVPAERVRLLKSQAKQARGRPPKRGLKKDPIFSIVGLAKGKSRGIARSHDEILYRK